MDYGAPMRLMAVPLMFLVLAIGWSSSALAGSAPQYERLAATRSFHWLGIDFGVAQFVDPAGFAEPEQIFPKHLHAWNTLFVDEGYVSRMKRQLGSLTSYEEDARFAEIVTKRPLPAYGQNDLVDASRIVPISQVRERLTEPEIKSVVERYCAGLEAGVGLLGVVDQFNHQEKLGMLHWVFFDLQTCEILDAPRFVEKNGGYGFRNRWMRPLKEASNHLRRVRREWAKLARWSLKDEVSHEDWVFRTLSR